MLLNSHVMGDEIKLSIWVIDMGLRGHPSHCLARCLLTAIFNSLITLQRSLSEQAWTPLKEKLTPLF